MSLSVGVASALQGYQPPLRVEGKGIYRVRVGVGLYNP